MGNWIFRRGDESNKTKIASRSDWTARAVQYHNHWVVGKKGPFQATIELVTSMDIKSDDVVLDVACGTGSASKEISKRLVGSGTLIGIDLSRSALSIANSWLATLDNRCFIEMDVENIGLRNIFDRAACQYALTFFPDPEKAMKEVRSTMKNHAKIGVVVHGTEGGVPYYSTIIEPTARHIPNSVSDRLLLIHRFGHPNNLRGLLYSAGFRNIAITKYTFEYNAGTFEKYWSDFFLNGYENALGPIVFRQTGDTVSKIKSDAKQLVSVYTYNDTIQFPWEVLIAIAEA